MHASFDRLKLPTAAFVVNILLMGGLVSYAHAQPAEHDLAFRNVDVFDGSRMIRGTTVVVRNGMIRAVGREVAIPPSAEEIDGRGRTLLPGFFDAHTHLGTTFGEQFLGDALNFGVTTELEMHGSAASLALRKSMIADSSSEIADFRTAGTSITAPGGHGTEMGGASFPTFAPSDDPQAFVDARIAEGADYIKIIYEHAFPTLTKQQIEALVAAAHRRNMLVVCHVGTQGEARDAIDAGVDGLAHIFADSPPDPGFAEFAAQHHVFVIPTLSIIEQATSPSEQPWWQDTPHVDRYITPTMRRTLAFEFPPGFHSELKLAHAEAAVGVLHDAGVPILAGTDSPGPGLAHGLSLHRELELLVRSGLTPIEALASATSKPARAFGFYDRGRIRAGLRADLVLVNGDPSVDITATRDIVGIWKLGIPHQRHTADLPRESK